MRNIEHVQDPSWFPVDFDVHRREVHFLRVSERLIEESSFVDSRLDAEFSAAEIVPLDALPALSPQPPPVWLWHTSFCGSTLLARMLHVAPYLVALREPLLLRRWSDACRAGQQTQSFQRALLPWLCRPWAAHGKVLVKPTHAALNIALDLMAVYPESRGIVLVSSLEDFLVSHLKKTAETLEKIPLLADRALRASRFIERLPEAALAPPDPLCGAALQWAAQREVIAEWLRRDASRMHILHWEQVRADFFAAADSAARWLQLGIPHDVLQSHVQACGAVHAKAPTRAYGADVQQQEANWLRGQFSEHLVAAMHWAERMVLPYMQDAALRL
jgi:hypothetical protein